METRYKARGFSQRLGSLRLPLFPQPRRRYYLRTINLEVGPFYSITVGSFYVVKATRDTKPSREVAIKTHTSLHAAFADGWEDFVVPELGAGFHV